MISDTKLLHCLTKGNVIVIPITKILIYANCNIIGQSFNLLMITDTVTQQVLKADISKQTPVKNSHSLRSP